MPVAMSQTCEGAWEAKKKIPRPTSNSKKAAKSSVISLPKPLPPLREWAWSGCMQWANQDSKLSNLPSLHLPKVYQDSNVLPVLVAPENSLGSDLGSNDLLVLKYWSCQIYEYQCLAWKIRHCHKFPTFLCCKRSYYSLPNQPSRLSQSMSKIWHVWRLASSLLRQWRCPF